MFVKTLQSSIDDIDNEWNDVVWPKVLKCGEIVETDVVPPRRCGRQTLRANIPGEPREYFKIVIGIEILNTIVNDLRDRFEDGQLTVSKMLVLNPTNLVEMPMAKIQENLEEVVQHFQVFFPDNGSALFAEIPVLKEFLQKKKVKFNTYFYINQKFSKVQLLMRQLS